MTNEAPERIWVSETDLGERWWQEEDYEPATRYVRADLLKAAVREAYERGVREAAETIRERWASSNAELETHVLDLLDKEGK